MQQAVDHAIEDGGIRYSLDRPKDGDSAPENTADTSPSASTSKGFLIVGTRVTPSNRKFKQTISRIRRFVE